MLDQEQFAQAIKNSINENEEIREEAENAILEFLKIPTSIDVCFELLYNNEDATVQSGAAIYARKVVKKFWKLEDFDRRAAIQQMLMQIISTKTYSEKVTNQILDIIKSIYKKDETNWPDLIGYLQTIAGSKLSLMLLSKIIKGMTVEFVESINEFILSISLGAINEEDLSVKLLGVLIFNQYIAIIKRNPESPQHLESLSHVLELSVEFDQQKDLETAWGCVNDLFIFDAIPEEMITGVVGLAMTIAQNKEKDPHLRHVPIAALAPMLEEFDAELLSQILTLDVDITGAIIEQEGDIPDDDALSEFDVASQYVDHSIMYPLIKAQIEQAFSSESYPHQIAGLLLFALLLNSYSDQVYNDIDEILPFLRQALEGEEELLKEAALRVVKEFPNSFTSANQYSPEFIPLIMPSIVSENQSLQHHAIIALCYILGHIDCDIPNQIEEFLKAFDQISEDSRNEYLSIFPNLILLSEDFSDENSDQIIQMILAVIETQDEHDIAVCFEIGSALLTKDDAQLQFVIENLFPFIAPFLQLDHAQSSSYLSVISEAYDFIGNMVEHLREESFGTFEQIVPFVIEALNDSTYPLDLKSSIVINISKLAKFGGPATESLVEALVPQIIQLIKSQENEAITNASNAVSKIKRLIKPEQAKEIFTDMVDCLNKFDKYYDYIFHVIKAISKLLLAADPSNIQEFLRLVVEFTNSVFENKWALLNEKSVLESPSSNDILSSLCNLFAAIVHFETPVNDVICQYLMQWMEKNSQVDLFQITGPLTDCIEYGFVSEETKQLIFTAISQIMPNANEPSLIQNIVYLMNILIQKNPQFVQTVVDGLPIFENYRQLADAKKFGFQDVLANLASLYVQLALKYPEMPGELILFSINQFPPYDVAETSSMANAMIEIVKNTDNAQLLIQTCLAFTRFFVQDNIKIEKAKVPDEVKGIMVQFLKAICEKDQQILMTLKGTYGKQRSKIQKIEALLSS